MTQLRFQGTKVINDGRTSLQLLKDLRHHMSRHRETRRPRYPMPGDITVYPCPWPDLGHRSYHMSSGRIGLLLYVSLFSVSVVRISVTPEFVCSSHSDGIGKITGHDGYNRKIPTRRKPLPAGLVGCFVVLRCCH